jgi:hypothetical protein
MYTSSQCNAKYDFIKFYILDVIYAVIYPKFVTEIKNSIHDWSEIYVQPCMQ